MTDVNKDYVKKYLSQAETTNDEQIKNNALYRAGTQMEVIDCNGNDNLTPEQQQIVINAANELLGGESNE